MRNRKKNKNKIESSLIGFNRELGSFPDPALALVKRPSSQPTLAAQIILRWRAETYIVYLYVRDYPPKVIIRCIQFERSVEIID